MSTASRPDDRVEDSWWFDAEPTAVDPAAQRRAPRGTRRTKRPAALPVRIIAAPFALMARWIRSSERLQRIVFRLVLVAVVLTFLAGSVGVILLNNLVIARTTELGELDDRRRELRRDNALLGAESARREAAPVVMKRANEELGMVHPDKIPAFRYLRRDSHTLTPFQRMQTAKREQARQEAAAQAKADANPAKGDGKGSDE